MSRTWCLTVMIPFALFVMSGGCRRATPHGTERADRTPGGSTSLLIAGNIPLTGPIAAFSGGYANGFQMGLDRVIRDNGMTAGAVRADFQDNGGDSRTAITVMQRQLLNAPAVYISGTTQMTEPLLPELSRRHVPHFLVSFDAFMTHGNRDVFRILPNFNIEAPLFLRFLRERRARRVFFFTPNVRAYLEQSDRLLLPALRADGVIYQRELFEFNHQDYRSIALRADAFRPDAIVVSGYSFHVHPILRALRELNLVDRTAVVATLDYVDLLHGDTPREGLRGVTFVTPECEIPGRVPGFAEWRHAYQARYNHGPSYVDAYAYDTARVLVAAHRRAGRIDEAAVRAVLPFDGVVGRVELDEERDLRTTLVLGTLGPGDAVTEWRGHGGGAP